MRSSIPLPLAVLALGACSSASRPPPGAHPPAAGREPVAMLELPDRSRWTPESGEGADTLGRLPDGTWQMVLQRLRLEQSPTGGLRRARDLLPASRAATTSLALPDRLGGGHLFVSSGNGATLWRARTFLGRLEALVRLPGGPVQVSAGVDRLLVRSSSSDRVWGVDPDSGALEAALPLPPSPRFGPVAFLDGWRGAAFSDLQGLMVTRDAGATWRPVPLPEAPRQLTIEGDLLAAQTGAGRLRIDPDTATVIDGGPLPAAPAAGRPGATRGPWGTARPLRVALEDGWPLLDGTAVALRQGRLARVKLDDGEVVESSFTPLPGEETSSCQAVRFGVDVGFVCGAPGRGTTIYAYDPPVAARPVLAFDAARAVLPSQNGWLVVRGGCARDASPSPGRYCVVGPAGAAREVSTVGDVGVERVVALSDGRVAVVVPPRGGSDGQLLVLPALGAPGAVSAQVIRPDEASPVLRRGLWLDGMHEVAPGELGGWAEASGLLAGVRLKLDDASVTAGPLQEGTHVALSGQRALAALGGEQMSETLDGGLTWRQVTAPPALGQGKLQAGVHCGPGGCALPFERGVWLRVGWGQPADPTDLEEAPERPTASAERTGNQPLRMACEVVRQEPIREPPAPAAARPPAGRILPPGVSMPGSDPAAPAGPVVPFHGVAPPAAPAGSLELNEGTASGNPARLYGWVPRGVAAGRAGRAQLRFLDRFDPAAPVRSTALSVMPWRDEQALRDAFGLGAGSLSLHSLLDPGGRAMVLASCQGTGCELQGAVAGRPLTALPTPEHEAMPRVLSPSASAVWLDETFFLALNQGAQLSVWRLEADRPRLLARLPRVTGFNNLSTPATLVRRARGRQLGLLARGGGTPGRSDVDLFVLPIDPVTGQVGPQVRLGPADLSWAPTRACGPDDDGWLAEVSLPVQPALRLPAGVRLGDVEVRARLDADTVCIDAMAARLLDAPGKPAPGKAAAAPASPAPAPGGARVTLLASSEAQRVTVSCAP